MYQIEQGPNTFSRVFRWIESTLRFFIYCLEWSSCCTFSETIEHAKFVKLNHPSHLLFDQLGSSMHTESMWGLSGGLMLTLIYMCSIFRLQTRVHFNLCIMWRTIQTFHKSHFKRRFRSLLAETWWHTHTRRHADLTILYVLRHKFETGPNHPAQLH